MPEQSNVSQQPPIGSYKHAPIGSLLAEINQNGYPINPSPNITIYAERSRIIMNIVL